MPQNRRMVGGILAAVVVLALAVTGSILFTNSAAGQGFLHRYPGSVPLPAEAATGFPAWVGWQHFLNFFLLALIIRTGISVRTDQRSDGFWTPNPKKDRKTGKMGKPGKKISLNLWLHVSLDVLWLINGIIFVLLLFVTGRWQRLIPTSWDVFPNALSAAMQYLSFTFPEDTAWQHYNSLQLLTYGAVVFIAAPLAAVTGWRTSEFWPKNNAALNRMLPMNVARAIHWPTMIFFVAFIVVHVILVLLPHAKTKLGYMFAGTNQDTWAGVWLTVAAVAVTVVAVFVVRPALVAPIAKLSGKVTRK